jgi:serine/threonine-protein kinase
MQGGLRVGQTLVGYRLLRAIGQGASSTVFLAENEATAQTVALKIVTLPAGEAAVPAGVAFLDAAATARRLVHPGIVAVLAAGVEGALGWLAMEPVPGADLTRYTRAPRLLPEPLTLRVAERLALALGHAHRLGIVHRDLKPANVLVHWPTDTIKLADFGIARAADAAQTNTSLMLGSPAYMAPEQLAGGIPTPRSDLYALGVTLFELLTGRLPHEGGSMGELLRQVACERAPELPTLRPGLPAELTLLLARLLAKHPGERPADADVLAQELRAIQHTLRGAGGAA